MSRVRRTCQSHEVAWGSDTDGQHKERQRKSEAREGITPLDRPLSAAINRGLGADTAVSIEREVVSGHAYAILAPDAVVDGWCGQDKPTLCRQMVFLTHNPWAPVLLSTGALVMEVP
ncbi:hypothetical protein GCM10028790_51100 [Micromonospora taraxaci]